MKRFLLSPLPAILLQLVLCLSSTPELRADHHKALDREFYELRVYQLTSAERADAFDAMMHKAAVPALKRLGVGPVGVFRQQPGANKKVPAGSEHWRYVIARFHSFEQFATTREKLAADSEFLESAGTFLGVGKKDPNYTRIDSSLFLGFKGMPKMVLPAADTNSGKRFFELRVYESHSERAAHLKVDMFNNGEFEIFKKVGLKPVFFGQALAASNLPQLTYMLVYDSEEKKNAAWNAFRQSPDWKKLKAVEKYQGTVSKIISTFLIPTETSQIR